ncbi:MAG: peptidylprolyl isomerase, partial [Gammaproteobacteria bacterium]|nr:peptidylprolyl isomerase [Gammaproteobacteria bacterium]
GGDLGWVREGQVVPEFFAAMSNLGKGKYTKVPVRTQFGWHVIRVNDVRDLKVLPFEKVRDQILQAVQAERIEEKISELRKTAKVQMN